MADAEPTTTAAPAEERPAERDEEVSCQFVLCALRLGATSAAGSHCRVSWGHETRGGWCAVLQSVTVP